ncbi:MAG: FtsW/RodA/SpoVE family cell cycle protein [Cellulosilyticaceae bacterium]
MNRYVDVFLKEVLGQVSYKKAHPYLAQELNDHLEFLKEELMEEGLSEEEAYKHAVKQMGEPMDIGKGLHKLHKPKMEWGLFVLLIGLIGIGFFALASYPVEITGIDYMRRQVVYSLLGVLIFVFIYFINYREMERFSEVIYLLGVAVMLIGFMLGVNINGFGAWIRIGGFTVKAVNLAIPLFMIGYIGTMRKWGNKGITGYFLLGGMIFLATMICAKSRIGEGVYVVVTLIGVSVYYLKSPEFKGNIQKVGLLLGGSIIATIGVMGYAIVSKAYRLERFTAWIKPEIDPMGAGYMPRVIREIVQEASWFRGSGEVFPTGIACYIPDGPTDLILTFIIGTMGWAVAVGIIVVIGIILIRFFKSLDKIKDAYGKLLMYSISMFFIIQYTLGILMNIGISPIGGSIPFVSYGGSKLVCDMALMGLFLGIYRRKDINIYELVEGSQATDGQPAQKVKRKKWLLNLAIDILRSSDEIEVVEVRFKKRMKEDL